MDVKRETAKDKAEFSASECGAPHTGCPGTWAGTCDRPAGHDGSHHCSQCNSSF